MVPNLKIITLRENKSYGWQTFVKSHKMLIGLLARRWCKSPKPFVYDKFAGKKPWFLIRIKDCWLCMISHPLLSSMYNLWYKSPCWKLSYRPCSPKLGLPMSFFFSVFGWVSIWSAEVLCDHLFAWASKTHSRRSLRWGTFRYSRGHLWPPWSELTWCHRLYWFSA